VRASSYVPVASSDLDAIKDYIKKELRVNKFKEDVEISPDIRWRPTLQIVVNKYTTVVFEVSEKVFPPIIAHSRMEIVNTNQPICVYSVCPEDEYVKNLSEARELIRQGFGLLTIDQNGNVTRHAKAIPLAQFIPKAKYDQLVKDISGAINQRIKAAFDDYNQNPISGLEEITKLVEGITFCTANRLVSKGIMPSFRANITLATVLADMAKIAALNGQCASIGGFHSYVKRFRNPAHHEPKNKKEAQKVLADCEAGFTEGIRKISDFISDFKKIGINVRL